MGSTRDFLRSALTDALLPVTRQLLEDVVMELLTDRQVLDGHRRRAGKLMSLQRLWPPPRSPARR